MSQKRDMGHLLLILFHRQNEFTADPQMYAVLGGREQSAALRPSLGSHR